ncbi:hypothetical protein ACJMK2_021651 [Sinanodonta woodiana]|uniref:Uncharacterized protein n=1 Tax=Sinanodonta woodiana TaxID=1069815 RepID=A0ABD3TGQ3_SINWO
MMEGSRCGRRKQRNPKRKNVEDGEDPEPSELKDNKQTEKHDHDLDPSSPKVTDNETKQSEKINGFHDGESCNKENSVHSEDEEKENISCNHSNTGCNCNSMETTQTPTSQFSSDCDNSKAEEKDEKSFTSEPSITRSSQSEEKPVDIDSTKSSTDGKKSLDEDKIHEYLSRRDTAVIFPEPVSDGEDKDHENDQSSIIDEEIILKCIHCTQSFSRANILRDHMREMHADKPLKFMCPKCEETFHQKSQLDKHLALHSSTSQICTVCNKTFANVYRLQRHMISHDESNDLRKFKCPECGKAFKFKHHLKEHVRIHSGEKPFECPNCHKRFSHSGSYSSHMTSKKCWVVMANKSRRMDVNMSDSFANKFSYTPSKIPYPKLSTSLQSPPHSQHHQLLQFHAQTPGIPAYYSPPMYEAPGIIPYAVYSVNQKMMTQQPSIVDSKIDQQLEAQKKMEGKISPSGVTQISPDVNSNTKLILPAHQYTSPTILPDVKKEKEEVILNVPSTKTNMDIDATEVKSEIKEESDKKNTNEGQLPCRFCGDTFNSPVVQHQHERYICKNNKDVVTRMAQMENSARQSPSSSASDVSHVEANGSVGTTSDEEEGDEKEIDGVAESKKFRMRSLFTEEQLHILKSLYRINPRPRKFELIRIGNKIGFPKRVVQVWFQNMRARDRKLGRHIPHCPSTNDKENGETASPTSVYIPNVPKPFPQRVSNHCSPIPPATATDHRPSPVGYRLPTEQPLDLSVRKTPPEAHGGNISRLSTPDRSFDDQVLNLSVKKPSLEKPVSSEQEKSRAQASVRDSAIFKYMQHTYYSKHLAPNGSTLPATFSQMFQNHGIPQFPTSSLPMQIYLNGLDKAAFDSHTLKQNYLKNAKPLEKEGTPSNSEDVNSGKSMIDEKKENSDDDHNDADDDDTNDDDDDDYDDTSRDTNLSLHDSQMRTSTPAKKVSFRSNVVEDIHNLATLAEAADQASSLSTKPKRIRKKSWRQMEADELQRELDDSLSTDEDQPMKKKRKSWKNHRVDRDEGMYACDQCNKMFSKQSSLARHKYEHSGARPFSCDLCPKAFKHKHHLTEHKRLHSGEKPFQCKKCGKRFSHSGSYSQHMNHRYNYCTPGKPSEDDADTEMSS